MLKLSKKLLLLAFLGLLLLNSGLSLGLFALSPVRSSKMLFVFVGIFLALALILFTAWRSEKTSNSWINKVNKFAEHSLSYNFCLVICGITFLSGWNYLFLSVTSTGDALNLYIAFRPLVTWLIITAVLLFSALRLWRQSELTLEDINKHSLKYGAFVFLVFLLVWGFIYTTRLGLDPVGNYWYSPGTPLLVTQVAGALLLGLLYLFFESKYPKSLNNPSIKIDLILGILIWLLACSIWLSEPLLEPTQFSPNPVPPNNAIYPFSDSASYDLNAQRFLIGEGLSLDPQRKPLYAFYLALLHIFAGQDYTRIIQIQIILLSLIPAILYILIGKLYSNRAAALVTAILFILREKNSIALSNIILVSHSKFLLTDLPATGLMVLLMALLIGWIMKPNLRQTWPLLAGCVFGLFLLLRTQVLILAPFILLSAYSIKRQQQQVTKGLLLMAAGVILIMLPWGVYSYLSASGVNSSGYIRQLAFQIQADTPEQIKSLAGETTEEYDARLQEQVFQFARENPGQLTKSIFAYFLHNVAQSVAYFPQSMQLETDVISYARRMPFWDNWMGNLPEESRGIFFINLAFIAFGIGTLFARYRFIGLIPILIYIGYVASLALPMISGWRFLMPVDWILLMYFSVGLIGFASILSSLLLENSQNIPRLDPVQNQQISPFPWKKSALIGLTILLFGSAMPALYLSTPKVYPPKTTGELIDIYGKKRQNSGLVHLPETGEISKFLSPEHAVGFYGKALYPRFFASGKGFRGTGSPSFRARDFARLGFNLIGSDEENIVLPLQSSPPKFPQGADVWIFGCEREANTVYGKYIEAWLVIIRAEDQDIFLLRSPWSPMTC